MRANIKTRGFTLIELMIVVVIIGILIAIAMPSYNNYVRRSRATEAMTALSNGRIQIEQFFQDNRTYVGYDAVPAPNTLCGSASTYFTYTCPTLTATTYKLQADGIGDMNNFQFTIDQSNVRTSLFDGTVGATCWLKAQGGSC